MSVSREEYKKVVDSVLEKISIEDCRAVFLKVCRVIESICIEKYISLYPAKIKILEHDFISFCWVVNHSLSGYLVVFPDYIIVRVVDKILGDNKTYRFTNVCEALEYLFYSIYNVTIYG